MQEPDYSWWVERIHWTLYQATCLLAGIEPPHPPDKSLLDGKGTVTAAIYIDLKAVCLENQMAVCLEHPIKNVFPSLTGAADGIRVKPTECVTWALSRENKWNGHRIPDELRNLAQPSRDAAISEKPLAESERNKLLKHIGCLALVLAEKSNRYKKGEAPNANQIASAVGDILDAMPDANTNGAGNASIRASIADGLKLLRR